jgi:nicotinate-nucleotide adenylyltransferase
MQKIGLFGGSFNPIHLGHLIMAEQYSEQCALDICYFIPASLSPFKSKDRDKQDMISHRQRSDILQLSIKHNKKFKIDTFELEQGGISFTIDTINHFSKRYPDDDLFLLIGFDQAKSFHRWKDWEEILDKVSLAIADRTDFDDLDERNEINERLSLFGKSPIWLENPLIDISSSEIRRRIKAGLSIKYLLNEKAEEYIHAYKIYY